LAVIDGRKASIGEELGGKMEEFNVMIMSEDLVADDSVGTKMLGYDPTSIKHIKLAQERGLGTAEDMEIVEIR
jgi:uncharacterized protein (DUF362 family)